MALEKIGVGTNPLSNGGIAVSLASGQAYIMPAGQYVLGLGLYTFIQQYDPVTTLWRNLGNPGNPQPLWVASDGFNTRLYNATGTVMGAVVTNGGSGYTNGIYYPSGFPVANNSSAVLQAGTAAAPTVTFAAGGGSVLALGNLVVGGAINTTITITAGGSNYTYPPTLRISQPPAGGVQATATCTISSGAINAVTVTNAGGGYVAAPTVTVINHPLDTTGSGGVLTVNATLDQSGKVVAVTVPFGGVGHTSVPAITFAPASTTAATAIMCFSITTASTASGATNMGNGNRAVIPGGTTAGSNTTTNPAITTGLFQPRDALGAYSTSASMASITLLDSGLSQTVNSNNVVASWVSNGTIPGATTFASGAVGGVSDTSFLYPV